jgi:hypothetical protein
MVLGADMTTTSSKWELILSENRGYVHSRPICELRKMYLVRQARGLGLGDELLRLAQEDEAWHSNKTKKQLANTHIIHG